MSETLSNTPETNGLARELVEPVASKAAFYFNLARRHLRQARTQKILRSLSDEQLRDAGFDRSLIHPGPELEVDARLMSALMSLR
ncbi:uncharacterized protein YjiS (DUF1127 family) [Neorhizobium galegae]|uniref:DUF1127 domain-containing protein n=1 Tax=Neorhizobium galegae TaxID=399 RepID=UPI001AE7AE67|nr:DUF1127 domain-containing protein [Neorhizobium galegae]MBP2562143.1 uncharacterized protein YjiS (DUF1127 family) [Neorhizobium galegae]MDQ0133874.1 uncharacterized protein YjiS (DUF1127 family) [Neorhizobium galegae]